MTELSPLNAFILEEGLEDWIPLPEIRASAEQLGLVAPEKIFQQVSSALVALLRDRLIQIWRGPWDEESVRVPDELAETLLLDARRYWFEIEFVTEGLDRVYYVNVDNILPS